MVECGYNSIMISVTSTLAIDEADVLIAFVRSSGPGGQNVNKVATAVQLRFNTLTPALPEDVRARLLRLAARRISQDGFLLIEANRYRTQEQNREDAWQRLILLLQKAAENLRPRHKTQPTLASKIKRIEAKRQHSQKKRLRSQTHFEDYG